MEMYVFDYSIIRKVMVLLSGSATKYCKEHGWDRATEKKYSMGVGCMNMMKFVTFCNRHRIPPSFIIHPSGYDNPGENESYIAHYTSWTPVEFDAQLLRSLFDSTLGCSIGSTLVELSSWAGVTPQAVNGWFNGTTANGHVPNIDICQFLRICNHFHINPSTVLRCDARPIPDLWQPVQYSIQLQRKLISDAGQKQADDARMIYRLRYELTRTYNRFKRLQESANETAMDGSAIASVGALHENEDNLNDISDLLLEWI